MFNWVRHINPVKDVCGLKKLVIEGPLFVRMFSPLVSAGVRSI
jgi:hypothetical protein